MLETVVLFLSVLGVVNSQDYFSQADLGKSISELLIGERSVTEECGNQLKLLGESLNDKRSQWASDMINSWSTVRQTIKYGNSYDFGNFDQCMNIQHSSDEHGQVNGQYCMFQFFSKSNRKISQDPTQSFFNSEWKSLDQRFGGAICLPSTCSPEVVRKFVQSLLTESDYEVALDYDQSNFCKSSKIEEEYSTSFVIFGFVMIALLICSVLSTIYDFLTRNSKEQNRNKWFLTFSIYTNGSNLFNINKEQSPDTIKCLNGLRVISAISIVYLHTHFHRVVFPIQNSNKITEYNQSTYGILLKGLNISVDTFFVLSGLLVTRSILKDLDSGKFNLWKLYFQRYMRLTPSLGFVLLAAITTGEYLVRNTPYAFYNDLVKPCKNNWWSTLLHIQVQANPEEFCMLTTWYLSVEWQMFLLAPILIYPAWKFGRKLLFLVLPAFVVVSSYFAYQILVENHLLVEDIKLTIPFKSVYAQNLYLQTQFRGTTFIIGMLLGVLFDKYKDKFTVNNKLSIILWAISAASLSVPFNANYVFGEASLELNAFALATARNFWAFAIAWIIFALEFGSCKWLSDFLSHKLWLPLGKLSFSIYLAHPVLQYALIVSQKQPISFETFQIIHSFFGDFSLAFVFAILLHLLVEEPFTQIAKLISKNWK